MTAVRLTFAMRFTLWLLSRRPGMTFTEIADVLYGPDAPYGTRNKVYDTLHRMERRGWVERGSSPREGGYVWFSRREVPNLDQHITLMRP